MKSPLAVSCGAAVLAAGLLSASAAKDGPSPDQFKPGADNTFTCQKESADGATTKKPAAETSNSKTTKALLETYYEGFAKKSGWESVISDNFKFVDANMTKRMPIIGKDAYIQIVKKISPLFLTMRVKEMMIADDRAYVLTTYHYVFPGRLGINGDVVELWKVKDGKLDTLTIFFDTLNFDRLSKPATEPLIPYSR